MQAFTTEIRLSCRGSTRAFARLAFLASAVCVLTTTVAQAQPTYSIELRGPTIGLPDAATMTPTGADLQVERWETEAGRAAAAAKNLASVTREPGSRADLAAQTAAEAFAAASEPSEVCREAARESSRAAAAAAWSEVRAAVLAETAETAARSAALARNEYQEYRDGLPAAPDKSQLGRLERSRILVKANRDTALETARSARKEALEGQASARRASSEAAKARASCDGLGRTAGKEE